MGCAAPVSPALAAGLPLAVAEQDHQLRGAKCFERKCCFLVTCRHTRKKTGRGACWLLLNEPVIPAPADKRGGLGPGGRGTDQQCTPTRRMGIFGKIHGQTAEALLSAEKAQSSYLGLGCRGITRPSTLVCHYLSAKTDPAAGAAKNTTAAHAVTGEL
jgi:hypothetical protein